MNDQTKNTISTRERIIAEAEKLLHVKGYRAMSVADIVDAAGVEKGSLYHYFSGKQELVIAVIQSAGETFIEFVEASLTGDTPRDRLFSFIESASEMKQKERFLGGCIFGNTALESSDTEPEIAAVVRDVFDQWAGLLEPVIGEAQQSGEIRDDLPSDDLAHHVIAVLEGAIMQGRLRKDATIFKSNIECLKRFLET